MFALVLLLVVLADAVVSFKYDFNSSERTRARHTSNIVNVLNRIHDEIDFIALELLLIQ